MNEEHLVISHVRKSFGRSEVLRDVTLSVPRGAFMTFLGPSGCGKTTLLRTIAGFYKVDEGAISIGGRVINDVPSQQRNAIMVFQDYALFPHMTVSENISYGLRVHKLSKAEIARRLAKTMGYLGIEDLGGRSPAQISGGQQQRVALARALVMEPEVLLLDEPLSNLDAKLRMNIRAELRQLQRSLGITTIYVTHDQSEALALSDQIAVMEQGRIIQVGSPWEVYFRPRNAFVADFVGTANILEGRVESASGGVVTIGSETARIRVEGGGTNASAVAVGTRVSLCSRPESIAVESTRPSGSTNVLEGDIANSIFEGSHVRYWVKVGQRTLVVDEGDTSERGILEGRVFLTLDPRRIHILRDEHEGTNRGIQ